MCGSFPSEPPGTWPQVEQRVNRRGPVPTTSHPPGPRWAHGDRSDRKRTSGSAVLLVLRQHVRRVGPHRLGGAPRGPGVRRVRALVASACPCDGRPRATEPGCLAAPRARHGARAGHAGRCPRLAGGGRAVATPRPAPSVTQVGRAGRGASPPRRMHGSSGTDPREQPVQAVLEVAAQLVGADDPGTRAVGASREGRKANRVHDQHAHRLAG